MKKHIKKLSKLRESFLDIREKSWNEKILEYDNNPKEIDTIGDQIYVLLKEHQDRLPVEFIIEELTKLGSAPCLVYDDNGHFAVTGDGFQEISQEPTDINVICFVEKEQWKSTIREALRDFLKDE